MRNEDTSVGPPTPRLCDLTQTGKYAEHPEQVGMVVDELELRRAKLEVEKRKLERAYAASEQARTRSSELQKMLAEATGLLGSTCDPAASIREIAEQVLPALGDVCVVDLVTTDGRAQRLAVAALDPAKQHLVRAARLVRPCQDPGSALATVLALGKPVLVPSFSASPTNDSELRHERFVHACAPRSALYVPIVAHGHALGAFTFLAVESNRQFGGADLAAAEQLARHAALALENTRLFDHARRAEQARAQLLECLGRDLARPISGLLTSVEALVETLPGPRGQAGRERVDGVRRGIQRTRRLLEDLIDIARIDSGELIVQLADVDLAKVVQDAIDPFRPAAREKEIDLQVAVASGARAVCCDRGRVVQVVHNLVDNALKFTPRAGRVRVGAERDAQTVIVTVQDSGPGIASQQVPHLFQRCPGSGDLAAGSGGLGLFIARSIIEAHDCAIWADLAVKTGTRFCFTLPVAQQGRT
jgi:signal transduction histidine kinase